ncbi:MAG: aminopeptidase [Caldilineaceae bacterium]
MISAELGYAPGASQAVAAAYRMGAPYVHVQWLTRSPRAYAQNVHDDYLDSYPAFEIAACRQMVDETWARLAHRRPGRPGRALSDVDPARLRRIMQARRRATCSPTATRRWPIALGGVRAVAPTPAWAAMFFPTWRRPRLRPHSGS